MPVLPRVASVHEATVQAVARGEVAPRRRRRYSKGPRLVSEAWHVRVHDAVWQVARTLTDDPACVQVVSEVEVVVWNHPAPWPVRVD